jgi:hypothetical protein
MQWRLFSLAHIVISTEASAERRNPLPQRLFLIDEGEGDFTSFEMTFQED